MVALLSCFEKYLLSLCSKRTNNFTFYTMKRFFVFAVALLACVGAYAAQPRAEYPRPQFERSQWVNLNGEWSYELDIVDTGFERKLYKSNGFADKSIVPFCPESKLSGVEHKEFITGIWYHRTIQAPADWSDKKIMLHFGAVYYEAEIYVDGQFVGRHFGGSSPFAYDVTSLLADGKSHDLVVRANSDLRSKTQGAGKQSLRHGSYGCVYTRTTGIWQTVWMEATDNYSLDYVQVITDIDQHQVVFTPRYYNTVATNTLTINIKDGVIFSSTSIQRQKVNSISDVPVVLTPLHMIHMYQLSMTRHGSAGRLQSRASRVVTLEWISYCIEVMQTRWLHVLFTLL